MACKVPLVRRDKLTGKLQFIPCNSCHDCRSRKASAWSFRLMQEEKHAISAYFITLTFNDNSLVRTPNGFLDISKRDLQLFFKRLRKMAASKVCCKMAGVPYNKQSIKYYAVGEYGGRFKRPHYHVIIFNASTELIERAWTKGHVHYGYVSGASVGYTMKYITKPSKIPVHRNDDRTPEFALISKSLGECYLTKNMIAWHHYAMTGRSYVLTSDGNRIAMPRYYRDKLYSKADKKAIAFITRQEHDLQQFKIDLGLKQVDEHTDIETYKFKQQKLNDVKNKTLVEAPLQCKGISQALFSKHNAFYHNSRSNDVSENTSRKIHSRVTASVS